MFENRSPWLWQLHRQRPVALLLDDTTTDVAIVGGGIAGVVTAYFTLRYTQKQVLLIEGHQVAHGATGHNAGQLASYFERPFSDIVSEFGLALAAAGQVAVESAWGLLDDIYEEARLQTPFSQFTGYAGCKTFAAVLFHLKDIADQTKAGIAKESMLLAAETPFLPEIPKEYQDYYTLIPQKNILSLLETTNTAYVAALLKRKGCLNSALFTEELVGYILATFSTRFRLVEHTSVKKIILQQHRAHLEMEDKKEVIADHVVLCTNGFERITLIDATSDTDIDTKFHHLVRGSVGYMAGYLDERDRPPVAISYLPEYRDQSVDAQTTDPYFYLTRRPFENEKKEQHNLVCVGGPESLMDDTNAYSKEHPYPEEAAKAIDTFVHTTYAPAPPGDIPYRFQWHGLMGYTPNGIRCIGFEPSNPVLLYNLGCNGVGILPSIFGGKKAALLLHGEKFSPSIFDPQVEHR